MIFLVSPPCEQCTAVTGGWVWALIDMCITGLLCLLGLVHTTPGVSAPQQQGIQSTSQDNVSRREKKTRAKKKNPKSV